MADRYIRFDITTNRVDEGYPYFIDDKTWPGLPGAGFDTDIDAATNWGNDKAYFFKG